MEVFTIEMQLGKDICKADIMHEPVAFKKIDTSIQLTPVEALASSLNYYGSVNMDYLVQTTGQTETELTEALAGEIFYNPLTDCWENKGKFLAGNVVEKCKEICTVLADLTGNAQNGRLHLSRLWKMRPPNLFRMKNLTSIWVSVGFRQVFTLPLPKTCSG